MPASPHLPSPYREGQKQHLHHQISLQTALLFGLCMIQRDTYVKMIPYLSLGINKALFTAPAKSNHQAAFYWHFVFVDHGLEPLETLCFA